MVSLAVYEEGYPEFLASLEFYWLLTFYNGVTWIDGISIAEFSSRKQFFGIVPYRDWYPVTAVNYFDFTVQDDISRRAVTDIGQEVLPTCPTQ